MSLVNQKEEIKASLASLNSLCTQMLSSLNNYVDKNELGSNSDGPTILGEKLPFAKCILEFAKSITNIVRNIVYEYILGPSYASYLPNNSESGKLLTQSDEARINYICDIIGFGNKVSLLHECLSFITPYLNQVAQHTWLYNANIRQ